MSAFPHELTSRNGNTASEKWPEADIGKLFDQLVGGGD
jgi:hypothetical protein